MLFLALIGKWKTSLFLFVDGDRDSVATILARFEAFFLGISDILAKTPRFFARYERVVGGKSATIRGRKHLFELIPDLRCFEFYLPERKKEPSNFLNRPDVKLYFENKLK